MRVLRQSFVTGPTVGLSDAGKKCMLGRRRFVQDAPALSHNSPAAPLTARKSTALAGRIRVPGDKSISHRALILAAMTVGETRDRRSAGG